MAARILTFHLGSKMTIMPEKIESAPELADIVYSLRQRLEQLEETVHELLMVVDDLSSRQDPERYMEG